MPEFTARLPLEPSTPAFVAVMLRRGLRDGEYEPHFERHPEQRQVRL